jgi:hypothetical protein
VETANLGILITRTQTINRRWKEVGENGKLLREYQKDEDHFTKREDYRK